MPKELLKEEKNSEEKKDIEKTKDSGTPDGEEENQNNDLENAMKELQKFKSLYGKLKSELETKASNAQSENERIKKLEEELENQKRETKLQQIIMQKKDMLLSTNIPKDFHDYVSINLEDNESTIKEKITKLEEALDKYKTSLLDEYKISQSGTIANSKNQDKDFVDKIFATNNSTLNLDIFK